MKILVTGSEGFIGSHLVEMLISKGHKVRCFVLYNSFNNLGWIEDLPNNIKRKIEIHFGDLRDIKSVNKAVKGCQKIVNLASLIAISNTSLLLTPLSFERILSIAHFKLIAVGLEFINFLQVCST